MNKSEDLKKFQTWHVEEPYENFVGPFYFKIEDNKPTAAFDFKDHHTNCLLYTSPSPRDVEESRMPSSA